MSNLIVCRTCGMELSLPAGQDILCCPACGTVNSRPRAEGEALEKLRRATRLRIAREYTEAIRCYEHVLVECDNEHEALWGKLLCQYGVEIVHEQDSGKRYPLVHIPQVRPMQETADFAQACMLAPEEVRRQYERDAAYIDDAQAEIHRLAKTCPPYDVFLCHKTSADDDSYTKDYVRAEELYTWLKGKGFRVFFAPKEAPREIAGANYEAMIYHALHTARVMLVVCSDPAHIGSTWVQSEWRRYLMQVDGGKGRLIPLMYGGMSPLRLPREFLLRKLEAVTMESLEAQKSLLRVLTKCCREPAPALAAPGPAAASASPADDQPVADYAPEKHFQTKAASGCCVIEKYVGPGGEVAIPPRIGGMRVVKIGDNAFDGCRKLRWVQIPDDVAEIGGAAFRGCSGLTSVRIPRDVTTITLSAFEGCTSLETVILPQGLKAIWNRAFFDCASLTDLILPDSLEVIEGFAFRYCGGLKRLTIPASVAEINDRAFEDCRELTLCVPENYPPHLYAQKHSFRYEVTAPPEYTPGNYFKAEVVDGGVSIKKYVGPMADVRIPPMIGGVRVVDIGQKAFEGAKIRSVSIPEGVKRIDSEAFVACSGLTDVNLPEGLTSIEYAAFSGCRALTNLSIPESVQAIGGGAFRYCGSLTNLSIPASVQVIGNSAFELCISLTSLSIPESVQVIGDNAFKGCKNLRTLTLPAQLPTIGRGAFADCPLPLGQKLKLLRKSARR